MSIPVVCPQCSAKLNAPDSAAGKRVKCPKCQTGMVVPEPLAEASPFEVVDEPQPAAKAAPKVAGRPRAAVKAVAEDDEDDRPRKRRRDDDDDDDDRPKKKKKKAAADNSMLIRNVVGGVLLVVLVAVAGYIFYDRAQKAKENEAADSSNANRSETPPADIPLPGAPVGTGGGPRPKGPVGPGGPGGNPVGKKPVGTPGQPTTLTSPKGFKVTFPGPYQSEDPPEEVRKKLGVPLTVHGSLDLNAGLVFLAGTADFPASASADEKKELVGRIVNTVVEDDGKTPVTSRKNVTVGGRTWEELTTKEMGGGTAVSRVLQTDQRVYVLAVLSFGGTPPADATKKFFDTFELTK